MHLPALAEVPERVELVGVCRLGDQELTSIATRWGFRIASENYRDILRAGIDVCIVASPPALHAEHTAAALHAGAHVLCEKPFTLSSADAWDLVELAKRKDLQLLVSYGFNFMPMTRLAFDLLRSPGIGEIESVSLTMHSTARELLSGGSVYPGSSTAFPPHTDTWNEPSLAGGGYGHAQLTHALAILLWLTDLRVADVSGRMSPPAETIELHTALSVRFDGGAVGAIHGSSSHLGFNGSRDQISIILVGSKGQLHIDYGRDDLVLFRPHGQHIRPPLPAGSGDYRGDGPALGLLDAAAGDDVACASGALGARVVEVLEAAYRSARAAGAPVSTATARTSHP